MKRIRQGWNTLRRSRRSGVSLIVALCAVAVLIGLSLSIVYSSSMLLSRANRKIGRERCYQLAQSFAQVLDSELQEYKTIKPELDTNFAPEGCFYREVNNILAEDTGLGIYDPDRSDETTACYNAGSTEDNYGRITILLRDVTDVQDPITGDTFVYDARNEGTEKAEQTTFNTHQVWVGVKAEKGADSYVHHRIPPKGQFSANLHMERGRRRQRIVPGLLGKRPLLPKCQRRGSGKTQGHWRGQGCPQRACGD